jgi:hypothetical protein
MGYGRIPFSHFLYKKREKIKPFIQKPYNISFIIYYKRSQTTESFARLWAAALLDYRHARIPVKKTAHLKTVLDLLFLFFFNLQAPINNASNLWKNFNHSLISSPWWVPASHWPQEP